MDRRRSRLRPAHMGCQGVIFDLAARSGPRTGGETIRALCGAESARTTCFTGIGNLSGRFISPSGSEKAARKLEGKAKEGNAHDY